MSGKIQITAAITLALFLGSTSGSQLKARALNQHIKAAASPKVLA